jgi:hypothetical protein
MDVTDGIGYKSNLKDTLLFRALTAKGARLRNVRYNCCDSRTKDQNKGFSRKSTNGTAIISAQSIPSKRKNSGA